MNTPGLQTYMVMAQELMRRVMAEEEETEIQRWLTDQVIKFGGKDEEAVLTWDASFDWYAALLEKRKQLSMLPPEQRRLLDFPWPTWNHYIDPLDPGMLMVVAAPDGAGKTIVAESIAEHWARKRNRVVFVHYELNRALMLDRRTVRHTGITRRTLKSGLLNDEELQVYNEMVPILKSWDGCITYVHAPGWTMDQTIQELRKQKAEGKCDVVVLDYLEKISASQRQLKFFGANQNQREADNVETIKNFAEQAEIPVLMLAQFSKSGKQKAMNEVDRTDIRGAGEKTEKANVVVLLQREKEDGGGYGNAITITVDKNTVGAQGVIPQYMIPEQFKIIDLEAQP